MRTKQINDITKIANLARGLQKKALANANNALKQVPEPQRAILSDLLNKSVKGEVTAEEAAKIIQQQHDNTSI